MAKKSMTPSERREAILKVLCQRRQEKIDNLAFEFDVSVRTIKNDIEELTLAHPIETVRGRYGGGVSVLVKLFCNTLFDKYLTVTSLYRC